MEAIRVALEGLNSGAGVLVLTDLFGGSPLEVVDVDQLVGQLAQCLRGLHADLRLLVLEARYDDFGNGGTADQAEADMRRAKAEAEKRRAMAVAREQEMRALVVENEAKVPLAIAEAFQKGNMGIMDYYRLKNIGADTNMRESIAKPKKSE